MQCYSQLSLRMTTWVHDSKMARHTNTNKPVNRACISREIKCIYVSSNRAHVCAHMKVCAHPLTRSTWRLVGFDLRCASTFVVCSEDDHGARHVTMWNRPSFFHRVVPHDHINGYHIDRRLWKYIRRLIVGFVYGYANATLVRNGYK